VEADPHAFNLLEKNRPESHNVKAALSNKLGSAMFTHVIHPKRGHHFGNGSIRHTGAHRKLLEALKCQFTEIRVGLITYGDLLRMVPIDRLDLFVLDVEGHELQVLEGMRGVKVLPRVFCIEHKHADVDETTESLGYRLDKRDDNNSFYIKI